MTPYQMSYWPLVVPMICTHDSWRGQMLRYHHGTRMGAFLFHSLIGGCGSVRKPSRGICIRGQFSLGGGASTGAKRAMKANARVMTMPVTDSGLVMMPRMSRAHSGPTAFSSRVISRSSPPSSARGRRTTGSLIVVMGHCSCLAEADARV